MKSVFVLTLCFLGSNMLLAQPNEILKEIAEELSSYTTYQTDCNYTFSMPYGAPMNFEALMITQKVEGDSLCGFYYNFNTKESFRGENFHDFIMYFNNVLYESYLGKVKKTDFNQNNGVFKNRESGSGYIPAAQKSHLFYNITPYELSNRILSFIKDSNTSIVQYQDTVITGESCLRFEFFKQTSTVVSTTELCFNKNKHFPVYYKSEAKSKMLDSYQVAYLRNTKINEILPKDYFSEENLLPKNWDKENATESEKKPQNLIGSKAPSWKLPVLNTNEYFSNNEFVGKYLLLEFTATWCVHCIEAAEVINKIEERYGDSEKLAILSIFSSNIDSESGIRKFAEKHNLKSKILFSGEKVGKEYHVNGYPNFFIISPEGIVFMNFEGYSESLENNLMNLLNELTK